MEKTKKTVIHKGQKPTPEQIAKIKIAAMKEFIADEDAPELTLEQYAEMAEFANARRFQSIWIQVWQYIQELFMIYCLRCLC